MESPPNKNYCFICGSHNNENEELRRLTIQSSSALRYPFFPIPPPPLFHFPQAIRICIKCDGVLQMIKSNWHSKVNLKTVISRITFRPNIVQEEEDDNLKEVRRMIMYPCDFRLPLSTSGLTREDVTGPFGKLPDELLDMIFGYLDPDAILCLRMVSTFMRNKSFHQFRHNCNYDLLEKIGNDYFFNWPHLNEFPNQAVIVHPLRPFPQGTETVNRLNQFFEKGKAVKTLKLVLFTTQSEACRLANVVLKNLTNLEELEINVPVDPYDPIFRQLFGLVLDDSSWSWPSIIITKLKKILIRCPLPKMKEFMKATPNVTLVQYDSTVQLLPLFKPDGHEELLWPHLESIKVPNIAHPYADPQELIDSLATRPIKRLNIQYLEYTKLRSLAKLLEKYGDTLEWVEFMVILKPWDNLPAPYEEIDLPTNLKQLRGFKLALCDPLLLYLHVEAGQACRICEKVSTQSEDWQRRRDFFKFGELLKDPLLFRKMFPRLQHLSLLVQAQDDDDDDIYPEPLCLMCPNCIARKHLFCETLVPPESYNPDLRVVELSYPTEREDPTLYTAWRERLAQAFPNAKM